MNAVDKAQEALDAENVALDGLSGMLKKFQTDAAVNDAAAEDQARRQYAAWEESVADDMRRSEEVLRQAKVIGARNRRLRGVPEPGDEEV